ncbi:TonB-dependent receptor [Cognatilysobacter tabacisoli]|uniref:TonB-dependent receptor n=1 Tax=Cognatilysobacter tabacisoli TaxID=2315424 RepID=UPI000E6B32D5|nr:TonB-dependent receptor [Lysobacter tabacisoli]
MPGRPTRAAWMLCAAAAVHDARGAEPSGPPAAPAAGPAAFELDTIVVTARRRAEVLSDVPMAVTVADGEELESRGAETIAALGAITPNLTVYPARAFNGTVTAFIRGIGQSDPIWSVEPGVGVYLDDVYLARPQGALLELIDVDRVEVLRGPQGTLYGKNTLGGAIKYVSREPEAEFSGSASATIGRYGRRDGRLVVNLPAGDRLRTRVALASFERDGYGRNIVTGTHVSARDAVVARATALWRPADDVEVRLAWDRTLDQSGAQGFRRRTVNPFDPARTPPDPGRHDVRSNAPDLQDLEAGGASATVDWSPGAAWTLRAISAYRSGESLGYVDFDTLPLNISTLRRRFEDRQASQEFQLHWNAGGTHAVAGLYLFDADSGGVGTNSSRSPSVSVTRSTIETRSAALYGHLTRALGDAWELDLGLRYTVERKATDVFNQAYADAGLAVPLGAPSADYAAARWFRSPSPRVGLAWRPMAATTLYAHASRGFKGGSFNIVPNPRAPGTVHAVDDETVTAVELGAKTAWWDGRAQLDLALFHNTYRDIQLSVFVNHDTDGDGVDDSLLRDFRNAGDGTTRGAELEWRVFAGRLRWTGHVGYLDAAYDRYEDASGDLRPSRGFANAPRWTAGSGVLVDVPLRRGGRLAWRVDGRYQSRSWPTPDLNDALAQDGYAVWSAGVAWTSPRERWQLALRGDNLADASYRTTGFAFPTLGILTDHYGPPRTVSLTVSYAF